MSFIESIQNKIPVKQFTVMKTIYNKQVPQNVIYDCLMDKLEGCDGLILPDGSLQITRIDSGSMLALWTDTLIRDVNVIVTTTKQPDRIIIAAEIEQKWSPLGSVLLLGVTCCAIFPGIIYYLMMTILYNNRAFKRTKSKIEQAISLVVTEVR